MTVQELKKIIDRLVNSGRGEYDMHYVNDRGLAEPLSEESVGIDDDQRRVFVL